MLDTLPQATFAENLNTLFRMIVDDSSVIELELIEVISRKSTPRQEQFSLIFRAPPDTQISQGAFMLEHDRLEAGELFLVPVALDSNGLYFQAVFNRLIEPNEPIAPF